jgi:MFS family permease
MVLFRFFDLFPQCVYYYLFPDVIPQKLMGTFVCLFGVTSAVGTILFHYLLLPYADSHPRWIYGSSAGLYLFTFTLMPLLVKEGKYPPPPPRQSRSIFAVIFGWALEVFSRRFYWKYFLSYSAFRWAYTPFNLFLILYARKQLGLGPEQFGPLMTVVLIVQMPALFLVGPLMDRYHPTRVGIVGFGLMTATALAGFFFIHNRATFVGCTIAVFIAVAIAKSAMTTISARLLPRARYGQFSAANSMVSETGMILLYYACGSLLDHLGQQFLFAWLFAFSAFGIVMIIALYRSFLACGGDQAYTPPAVAAVL